MTVDGEIGMRRPSAEPTREFFVGMLTRDIPLEQAILDLVDNSVDAAKAVAANGGAFENHRVEITLDGEGFSIVDDCGGFGREAAINYAFRFGRPEGAPRTPNSIGQFGVGMKRALFKIGEHFTVRSATSEEEWAIALDVPDWLENGDWHFPWVDFGEGPAVSREKPGTEIVVDRLRRDVAMRFATVNFRNLVSELIRSKHRQFISQGLSVTVNGTHIDASDITLSLDDQLKPGRDEMVLEDIAAEPVTVRILVGVGASIPREAGWYIICNGRVVLSADRREVTGWGLLENESDRLMIPNFHNQYARFRGIVWFDCADSSRVPWNTTKTDVDVDSAIWQRTFLRMIEMTRPVIGFLNDLDRDIDENTRENSPLFQYVSKAGTIPADRVRERSEFIAPNRESVQFRPRTIKIQYSRLISDVEFLKDALSVTSARAVGETTFDMALETQRSE
jgi:hypothetical protein